MTTTPALSDPDTYAHTSWQPAPRLHDLMLAWPDVLRATGGPFAPHELTRLHLPPDDQDLRSVITVHLLQRYGACHLIAGCFTGDQVVWLATLRALAVATGGRLTVQTLEGTPGRWGESLATFRAPAGAAVVVLDRQNQEPVQLAEQLSVAARQRNTPTLYLPPADPPPWMRAAGESTLTLSPWSVEHDGSLVRAALRRSGSGGHVCATWRLGACR